MKKQTDPFFTDKIYVEIMKENIGKERIKISLLHSCRIHKIPGVLL